MPLTFFGGRRRHCSLLLLRMLRMPKPFGAPTPSPPTYLPTCLGAAEPSTDSETCIRYVCHHYIYTYIYSI